MFDPDYSVHLGEILRDELAARGIKPDAEMQVVLDGGVLSNELAERLETVTGLRARVWKNLMRYYYEWAMKRLEVLFDKSIDDRPLADEEKDEFDRLANLIEAYEDEHCPIGEPTLAGMIEFWKDQQFNEAADLKEVAERLQKLYTDEEAVEWLWAKNDLLGGESAVRLLQDGRKAEVLALIDRIASEIDNTDMFRDDFLVYISNAEIEYMMALGAGGYIEDNIEESIPKLRPNAILRKIAKRLFKLYTKNEVTQWANTKQKMLGDKTPAALILDGRVGEVLALLDRIEAGAYL